MTDLTADPTISTDLDEWFNAVQQAALWKVREMDLRMKIFNKAFPSPTPGTNKAKLPHGKALVADYKLNYKIDQPGLEAAKFLIPPNVFDSVISYKPDLRPGAYRDLEREHKLLFAPFITETPGSPKLEIKDAARIRW